MYSEDFILISTLRDYARSLPSQANQMAIELSKIADEVETLETREQALQRFDKYAWHYKGLRDCIVPGVTQAEWEQKVSELSNCSKAAVKVRQPQAWWSKWFG